MKNPTRPNDSPISVETAGGWDASKYRNYTEPRTKPAPGQHLPVFGRNRVDGVTEYETVHDYQKSKTPEAIQDKALEAAIEKDLKTRNIK